jgi:hypothetical protein
MKGSPIGNAQNWHANGEWLRMPVGQLVALTHWVYANGLN